MVKKIFEDEPKKKKVVIKRKPKKPPLPPYVDNLVRGTDGKLREFGSNPYGKKMKARFIEKQSHKMPDGTIMSGAKHSPSSKKIVIKRKPKADKKIVIKRKPKADKKIVIKRKPKEADKKIVIKRKPKADKKIVIKRDKKDDFSYLGITNDEAEYLLGLKPDPRKKVVIKRKPKADKKVVIKREPKKAVKKVVIKKAPSKPKPAPKKSIVQLGIEKQEKAYQKTLKIQKAEQLKGKREGYTEEYRQSEAYQFEVFDILESLRKKNLPTIIKINKLLNSEKYEKAVESIRQKAIKKSSKGFRSLTDPDYHFRTGFRGLGSHTEYYEEQYGAQTLKTPEEIKEEYEGKLNAYEKKFNEFLKEGEQIEKAKKDEVDEKPQPKKSQAQQKREAKAQEEAERDQFEKSGKIPYNKLDDFYKTIDNISKGKSRRKEKQFTDIYGRKLLEDVFEGQFGRDFYSTPIKCLDAVKDDFKLSRGANHVLEVSAGLGAMLYWNMEADDDEGQEAGKYTAIEINPKFTKFLKGSFGNRVKVEEGDFFTKSEKYIKPMKGGMNDRGANDFDFILCNPPFSLFRDGKNNKKAYLEFLWRSVKILQQSSKTYEKNILFISPSLLRGEDVGDTLDPYNIWNISSKPVEKRILKENNWTNDDIEIGEVMPNQIQLVGKCADFGGTGINASIYNIIVY